VDKDVFGMAPAGPHREAIAFNTLHRNARILSESEVDTAGGLYSPLCYFLVAACRKLGMMLGPGHWRAAVENVAHLQQQVAGTRAEAEMVGLEIGSAAGIFKQQLDEAIRQAGLATGVTYLSKENREVALALAINWGIRFLLAYAVEVPHSTHGAERKDLSWLADQVGTVVGGAEGWSPISVNLGSG
jgi:hypothetical protein